MRVSIQLAITGGVGIPSRVIAPERVVLIEAVPGLVRHGLVDPDAADAGHFLVIQRGAESPGTEYLVRDGYINARDVIALADLLGQCRFPGRQLQVQARLSTADVWTTTRLTIEATDGHNGLTNESASVTTWCAGYEGADASTFASIVNRIANLVGLEAGSDDLEHL